RQLTFRKESVVNHKHWETRGKQNAGFSTRTDLILVPGAIEADPSRRGNFGGSQMRSKPSPQQKISEQIGKELRAIYDDVLHEPIPDRFLALVDRLGEEIVATAPASRRPVRSLPRGVTRLERV